MKRVILTFLITSFLAVLIAFVPTVFASNHNEAETKINQYIKYIKSNKWDEYVELFNYDSEVKEHLLSFLKDSKNQSNKEGIHGIQNIKLVSLKLSNDSEFNSKGDHVYDVLLYMKVHKTSEFYMNGVTHHVFVFNMTNEGFKIDTVYFKGLAIEKSEDNMQNWLMQLNTHNSFKVVVYFLVSLTIIYIYFITSKKHNY